MSRLLARALPVLLVALAGTGCFPNRPALSPDGAWVAIALAPDEPGSAGEPLYVPARLFHPNPDRSGTRPPQDLYVASRTNAARVWRVTGFALTAPDRPIHVSFPAWRPDQDALAFVTWGEIPGRADLGVRSSLYVVPNVKRALASLPVQRTLSPRQAEGRRLRRHAAPPGYKIIFPTYSPDGRRLALIETAQDPDRRTMLSSGWWGTLRVLDLANLDPVTGLAPAIDLTPNDPKTTGITNVVPEVTWLDAGTLVYARRTSTSPEPWQDPGEIVRQRLAAASENGSGADRVPVLRHRLWAGTISRYHVTLATDGTRLAFDQIYTRYGPGSKGTIYLLPDIAGPSVSTPVTLASGTRLLAPRIATRDGTPFVAWADLGNGSRARELSTPVDGGSPPAPPTARETPTGLTGIPSATLPLAGGVFAAYAMDKDRQRYALRLVTPGRPAQPFLAPVARYAGRCLASPRWLVARARRAAGFSPLAQAGRVNTAVLALDVKYYRYALDKETQKLRQDGPPKLGQWIEYYRRDVRRNGDEQTFLRVEDNFLGGGVYAWDGEKQIVYMQDKRQWRTLNPKGRGAERAAARERGRDLLERLRMRRLFFLEDVLVEAQRSENRLLEVSASGMFAITARWDGAATPSTRYVARVQRFIRRPDPFTPANEARAKEETVYLYFDIGDATAVAGSAPGYLRQARVREWIGAKRDHVGSTVVRLHAYRQVAKGLPHALPFRMVGYGGDDREFERPLFIATVLTELEGNAFAASLGGVVRTEIDGGVPPRLAFRRLRW